MCDSNMEVEAVEAVEEAHASSPSAEQAGGGASKRVEEERPPPVQEEEEWSYLSNSDTEEDSRGVPDLALASSGGLLHAVGMWVASAGDRLSKIEKARRGALVAGLVKSRARVLDSIATVGERYKDLREAGRRERSERRRLEASLSRVEDELAGLRSERVGEQPRLSDLRSGLAAANGRIAELEREVGVLRETNARLTCGGSSPAPAAEGGLGPLLERVEGLMEARLAPLVRAIGLLVAGQRPEPGGLRDGGGPRAVGSCPAAAAPPRRRGGLLPPPPPPPTKGDGEWVRVGRKKRRQRGGGGPSAAAASLPARRPSGAAAAGAAVSAPASAPAVARAAPRRTVGGGGAKAPPPPPPKRKGVRLPGSSAVLLRVPEGSGLSYRDAMMAAEGSIDLSGLGVPEVRTREALAGGLLLEIPGGKSGPAADRLAEQLSAVLGNRGVRVSRPAMRTEMFVRGLGVASTPEQVAAALAQAGGCPVGDVRVGPIRGSPAGRRVAWAQCPSPAADRIIREGAGKIRVGWALAGVEPLGARPLRCFRCLALGHVGRRCTSAIERAGRCFRCGDPAHKSRECEAAEPRCPLCADLGLPHAHTLGGRGCAPPTAGGRMPPPTATPPSTGGRGRRKRKRTTLVQGVVLPVLALPGGEGSEGPPAGGGAVAQSSGSG